MASDIRGLWSGSPFLGSRPEALILFELTINPASTATALASAVGRYMHDRGGALRWQIGFGPPLFERCAVRPPGGLTPLRLNGDDRFGIPSESGTDLLIAVGGEWNDVIEAARTLRSTFPSLGVTAHRLHIGNDEETSRDHSGFLDGTSNLQELTPEQFGESVFVQREEDAVWEGGSYLVLRKYEEDLEMWNDLPDFVQEHFIGRKKESGRYMNGAETWSESSWEATPDLAHIRCCHPRSVPMDHPGYWKERIYRRSIKFTERNSDGGLRHGLLFLALVRDPHEQFERIHNTRLLPAGGGQDFLMSSGYIRPIHSACYFLPGTLRQIALIAGEIDTA